MDLTTLALAALILSLAAFGLLVGFRGHKLCWPIRRRYTSLGVNLIMSGDPERFWRHRSRAVGIRPSPALKLAERGQAVWEYAIITAFIALALWVVSHFLAEQVQAFFAPIRAMFQT